MRTSIALALVLLLAACGASDDTGNAPPDTTGDAAETTEPAEGAPPTVTATWRGEGNLLEFSAWEMGCAGCESTIQKRVGALDGVTEVEADKASAVVKVTLGDGVDREQLTEQITKALEEPESGKIFEIIRPTP